MNVVASWIWGIIVAVNFIPFLSISEPQAAVEMKTKVVHTKEAGIGDRIRVEVVNLSEAVEKDNLNPRQLVLYLDGRVLRGVMAEPVEDPGRNLLEFKLERTEKSKDAWLALLGSPTSSLRKVTVGVGFEDKQQIPVAGPGPPLTLDLRIFHFNWFLGCTIGLFVFFGLFIWLAVSSNIIRDAGPAECAVKPYSLGRLQMAFWFFLVVGGLVFIYLITGDYNVVTEQALLLIGIGTGTALGAIAIDNTKRNVANRELALIRPEQNRLTAEIQDLTAGAINAENRIATRPPGAAEDQSMLSNLRLQLADRRARLNEVNQRMAEASTWQTTECSQGFFLDLLTDASGVSFHRFQILVWTLVLGFIFCVGVYRNLAMPEFSATLLVLTGISAGTYLGFKIPERQR